MSDIVMLSKRNSLLVKHVPLSVITTSGKPNLLSSV